MTVDRRYIEATEAAPPPKQNLEVWRATIDLISNANVVPTLCAIFIVGERLFARVWNPFVAAAGGEGWISSLYGHGHGHANRIIEAFAVAQYRRAEALERAAGVAVEPAPEP